LPFGWGYILAMYLLAFIVGFIYRAALRKTAKKSIRKKHKNIGKGDRAIRLFISFALLFWAITTTWNPILFFLQGSHYLRRYLVVWFLCPIGKNTCLLE
jgi:Na+/glutamate symporter